MLTARENVLLRSEYGPDIVHGWPHVERVLIYSGTLSRDYPECSPFVLSLACLFHDIRRSSTNHGDASAKEFNKRFKQRLSVEGLHHVESCIRGHDKLEEPATIEGKILQDADRLDCLGAIGLVRMLRFSQLQNPLNVVKHMESREMQWIGKLWTPKANKIAAGRVKLLQDFIKQVREESKFLSEVR